MPDILQKEGPDISYISSLLGDPSRANMISALLVGNALTATELANEAGITPQTASGHLAKLTEGGLVTPLKTGRHKYYSLASEEVSQAIEVLTGLAAGIGHLRTRTGPNDDKLRQARSCYNHLAGTLSIQMYRFLIRNDHLKTDPSAEQMLVMTEKGRQFFTGFGIDLAVLEKKKEVPLCRNCLDWSMRQYHLSGSLGRAMLSRMVEQGWARRPKNSRLVVFSDHGLLAFQKMFPLD